MHVDGLVAMQVPQTGMTFEDVFLREYVGLVRLATAICGDVPRAEEVTQEAFAAALTRWDQLASPGAFLHRVVVNRAIDVHRKSRRLRLVPLHDAAVPAVPDRAIDGTSDPLWGLVDALPDRQRAVIILRFLADMSLDDIASVLERPVNTIKSDQRRALIMLSKQVRR